MLSLVRYCLSPLTIGSQLLLICILFFVSIFLGMDNGFTFQYILLIKWLDFLHHCISTLSFAFLLCAAAMQASNNSQEFPLAGVK